MPKNSVSVTNAAKNKSTLLVPDKTQLIELLLLPDESGSQTASEIQNENTKLSQYFQSELALEQDTKQTNQSNQTTTSSAIVSITQKLTDISNRNSIDISQHQSNLAKFVDQLFDFIIVDFVQKTPIIDGLNLLRTPYYMALLAQPLMLAEPEHSARMLLNDIARSGLLWEENDTKSAQTIEQIEHTAQEIIRIAIANEDLGAVFDSAAKHFRRFTETLIKRAQIFEKRIKEAEEGKAKAAQANLVSQQALAEITCKQNIPAFIQEMFAQAWQHIVFLDFLKHQDNSVKVSLELAKSLLVSIQPINQIEELAKFVELQPELIEGIRAELEKSAYSFAEVTAFFEELDDFHNQLIDEAKTALESPPKEDIIRLKPTTAFNIAPEAQTVPVVTESIESLSIAEWVEQVFAQLPNDDSHKLASFEVSTTRRQKDLLANQKIIKHLKPGRWVTLLIEKVETQLKLAAYVEATDNFIFVNGTGNKVAELNSAELVEAYDQKNLKLLENTPLIERAFHSVFDNFISAAKQKPSTIQPSVDKNQITPPKVKVESKKANTEAERQENEIEISFDSAPAVIPVDAESASTKLEISQSETSKSETSELDTTKTTEKTQSQVEKNIVPSKPVATTEEITSSNTETPQTADIAPENIELITQLSVGSWVEFRINGNFKKCRLAAKINSSGKYIFTDRAGIKIKECLTDELKNFYRQGEVKFEHENGMFDKALESVISNMRNFKSNNEQ